MTRPADYQIVVFAKPGRGGKRKLLRTFCLTDSGGWEVDDAQISRKYLASLHEWLLDTEIDPTDLAKITLGGTAEALSALGLHTSIVSNGTSFTLHVTVDQPAGGDSGTSAAWKPSDHPLAAEYREGAADAAKVMAYEIRKASDRLASRQVDDSHDDVLIGKVAIPKVVLDKIFDVLRANGRHAVNIAAVKTVRSQYGPAIARLASLPDGERKQHQETLNAIIANAVLPSSH